MGKGSPTPGLFLAAYTGSLYGLCDLSAWFAVIDFDVAGEVISAWLDSREFLSRWYDGPLFGGILGILMLTPAIVSAAIWLTGAAFLKAVRDHTEIPSTWIARARLGGLVCISASPALFGAWLTLTNPVAFVRSVRIPYLSQVAEPPPVSKYETSHLSSVCSWTISEGRNELLILFADNRIVEYEIPSGRILRKNTLECAKLLENVHYGVSQEGFAFQALHTADFNMNGVDHHAKIWRLDEDRILLCTDHFANAPAQYEIFDLRTGKRDTWALELKLSSRIRAVSANGIHAVVEELGNDPLRLEFSVWNLKTRLRQPTPKISPLMQTDAEFAINNPGTSVRLARQLDTPLIPPAMRYVSEPQALSLHELSDNAVWVCSDDRAVFEQRAVLDRQGAIIEIPHCSVDGCWIGRGNRTPVLDSRRGKLILLQNDLALFSSRFATRLSILRRLGGKAYRSRLFQFDLATRNHTSTSIWPIRFEHVSTFSAKFSPCGRYLWVMDEYDKGYIFHEFALR